MPIVTYAKPGAELYVTIDNQSASSFNMTAGTGKKSSRYYVPDTTIAKAKIPKGTYSGGVYKGKASTASQADELVGVFNIMWDGQRETNWNEVLVRANAIKTPLTTAEYQKLAADWGVPLI